jgi:hypothetical protein
MESTKDGFDPQDMYHMFDLQILESNIWYFRNVLSYPKELLAFIEQLNADESTHDMIAPWSEWNASNDSSVIYGSNKTLNVNSVPSHVDSHSVGSKMLYVKNSLVMAAEMSVDKYLSGHGLDSRFYNMPLDHLPIRRWDKGSSMGPHCDNYDGHDSIAFSMIMYINDDYLGGELSFPNHDLQIKPSPGSIVIFPSVDPYLHQVKTVTAGKRYTSHLSVYKKMDSFA